MTTEAFIHPGENRPIRSKERRRQQERICRDLRIARLRYQGQPAPFLPSINNTPTRDTTTERVRHPQHGFLIAEQVIAKPPTPEIADKNLDVYVELLVLQAYAQLTIERLRKEI